MLLRKNVRDYRAWYAAGMTLLALGLGGQTLTGRRFSVLGFGESLPPGWSGFIDGMALVFVMTSIFFNLRGFMLYRAQRSAGG